MLWRIQPVASNDQPKGITAASSKLNTVVLYAGTLNLIKGHSPSQVADGVMELVDRVFASALEDRQKCSVLVLGPAAMFAQDEYPTAGRRTQDLCRRIAETHRAIVERCKFPCNAFPTVRDAGDHGLRVIFTSALLDVTLDKGVPIAGMFRDPVHFTEIGNAVFANVLLSRIDELDAELYKQGQAVHPAPSAAQKVEITRIQHRLTTLVRAADAKCLVPPQGTGAREVSIAPRDQTRGYYFITMQEPFPDMVFEPDPALQKDVETRFGSLPLFLRNRKTYIIRTKRTGGGARYGTIIGYVCFRESWQYRDEAAWLADFERHRVPPGDSRFGWKEGKWGWEIEFAARCQPVEFPILKASSLGNNVWFLPESWTPPTEIPQRNIILGEDVDVEEAKKGIHLWPTVFEAKLLEKAEAHLRKWQDDVEKPPTVDRSSMYKVKGMFQNEIILPVANAVGADPEDFNFTAVVDYALGGKIVHHIDSAELFDVIRTSRGWMRFLVVSFLLPCKLAFGCEVDWRNPGEVGWNPGSPRVPLIVETPRGGVVGVTKYAAVIPHCVRECDVLGRRIGIILRKVQKNAPRARMLRQITHLPPEVAIPGHEASSPRSAQFPDMKRKVAIETSRAPRRVRAPHGTDAAEVPIERVQIATCQVPERMAAAESRQPLHFFPARRQSPSASRANTAISRSSRPLLVTAIDGQRTVVEGSAAGDRHAKRPSDDGEAGVGMEEKRRRVAPTDVVSRLGLLVQMYTAGALNEAEFTAAKVQLLGTDAAQPERTPKGGAAVDRRAATSEVEEEEEEESWEGEAEEEWEEDAETAESVTEEEEEEARRVPPERLRQLEVVRRIQRQRRTGVAPAGSAQARATQPARGCFTIDG
eukprot:gene1268-90_t